ncbi:hypothetical protein AUK04_04490 [Candidatus Roizmanbacteria bacterium CG2_30_33_16]|uniref:Uncharacterized protein n=5 Tax=Candidatus Roizmaniibacteriota TaxID=1752723 RepID=A0A2M7E5R8_9BACT|nr:hypothetical protein [Candidatus Roizmanbacteria bacterium]OIP82522.1 MAG: hypothetical protein AUK04_04490 [Candidatus Roizmanbacteria bacterium CG2_30_33_16]PIP64600.1 MAG: hypothetical protein COW96_01815 [Candidatus Roizmanbacteria bacterium CG22_combo_CG10-13_8_21_14_all_33_16]PIV63059.1 MAG: hypothetical protein COS12_00195 [Candidatus Roizmanbacteria bacterium CG01_land_8_20_14_3_00_33_9]PIX72339.1 MAG: hypothetical protein COZ39_03055 [Candidatus Roizmanbacteria bacterium CG_4_10_14_
MNNNDSSTNQSTMTMVELTTIIKRYLADLNKLKEDMKMQKQMYNEAFSNDATYSQQNDKVKKLNRETAVIKERIVKQPAIELLVTKIKQIRDEIKVSQEALSDYLREYQKVSNATTIEDDKGEVLQIIPSYRLVRKNKFNP